MSDSDIEEAVDDDVKGFSIPLVRRRIVRNPRRAIIIESDTDDSEDEDEAVKLAKQKSIQPKKSQKSNSLKNSMRDGQESTLEKHLFEKFEMDEIDKQRQILMKRELEDGEIQSEDDNNPESKRTKKDDGITQEALKKIASERHNTKVQESFTGPDGMAVSPSQENAASLGFADSDEDESQMSASNKPINNIEDLSKFKLNRSDLSRFVYLPFFNKLVIGSFVRIGIGRDNPGRPVYRIAEIAGVEESGPYTFENIHTNKRLVLKHGSGQKTFSMEFVSNQPFEANEWSLWLDSMFNDGLTLPTLAKALSKEKDIIRRRSHVLTNADIDYSIKEKKKFVKAPVNFAVEKNRLLVLKAGAEGRGDYVLAEEIQKEISELDARAFDKERQRGSTSSVIAMINQKRRAEMQQKLLDPNRVLHDPVDEESPFVRKHHRSYASMYRGIKIEANSQTTPNVSTAEVIPADPAIKFECDQSRG